PFGAHRFRVLLHTRLNTLLAPVLQPGDQILTQLSLLYRAQIKIEAQSLEVSYDLLVQLIFHLGFDLFAAVLDIQLDLIFAFGADSVLDLVAFVFIYHMNSLRSVCIRGPPYWKVPLVRVGAVQLSGRAAVR